MNALLWMSLIIQATAGDPSEPADGPQRLLVCIRAADNPILTSLFLESVRHQVQDQMRNYFGAMADVDVRLTDHWLLEPYARQAIDYPVITPQLFAEHDTTEKIFLIGIDYRDGCYHLSWRQIDGIVRQVGPIRSRSTPDRQWVAKALCLAIKENFAVFATVTPGSSPTVATVDFARYKGDRLLELLGEQCVLQPYFVLRGRGGMQRRAVPNAYLCLTPQESTRKAQVVNSGGNSFPQRAVIAGYEALKLNTRMGRLRLRLIDAKLGIPAMNCSVSANDQGFDATNERDILPDPDKEGFVLSPRGRQYRHLAYVTVTHAGDEFRLPVPITDDVTERVIKLPTNKDAQKQDEARRDLRFLLQDTQSILAIQSDTFSEFNALNASKRYEEALQKIDGSLEFVVPRLEEVQTILRRLERQARDMDDADDPLLQATAQQVGLAEQKNGELRDLKNLLVAAVDKRDAQARADVIIQLGQQAEREGDVDEAILRYELALNEQKEQTKLREKIQKLKTAWATKDSEHEKAHATIYDRWAKAEVTDIESLLPDVQQAFQVLNRHRDDLRARRLSAINSEQLSNLNAIIDQLAQRDTQADKEELKKYAALTETLANLQGEVAQLIEEALTGAPATSPPSTVSPGTDSDAPPLMLDDEQ